VVGLGTVWLGLGTWLGYRIFLNTCVPDIEIRSATAFALHDAASAQR